MDEAKISTSSFTTTTTTTTTISIISTFALSVDFLAVEKRGHYHILALIPDQKRI
ncbi:hypothetical protein E2C01_072139 [Portunus trituberculatus]|uniref:Uncharacterized protein n=1 Tax=Portunus trituberculatus TaxID=210409 RepID=A0A5B7I708_PORTR|nr:hypothetical protein [Portunus trituberculatus]